MTVDIIITVSCIVCGFCRFGIKWKDVSSEWVEGCSVKHSQKGKRVSVCVCLGFL